MPDHIEPLCIADLYPLSRPQSFPETVKCLRVKNQKSIGKFVDTTRKAADGLFDAGNLWFRGLSLNALTLSMSFFIPVISTNMDNEFGPGIYASNRFEEVVRYAKPNGAVMVFRDPDLRDLTVWRPDVDEWNSLTANWLQLPRDNSKMPATYKSADIIIGPTSSNQRNARKKRCWLNQGTGLQMAAVSHEGCKCLAAALEAIIYITS